MNACPDINFVKADSSISICDILNKGEADALVTNIDVMARDIVLTYKENLEMTEKYFSSCFIIKREEKTIIVADVGICKTQTQKSKKTVILETYEITKTVLDEESKIAMLSFSTFGNCGKDPSIEKITATLENIKAVYPEIEIDGEIQLNVAINKAVAKKRKPETQKSLKTQTSSFAQI